MGVDTKGMVKQGITVLDIAHAIKSLYGEESQILPSGFDDNYSVLEFSHKNEHRRMNVHENYDDLEDVPETCTLLSFGMWGSSTQIMRDITGVFGGMVMENDCDGEWESVVKTIEFENGNKIVSIPLTGNAVRSQCRKLIDIIE